MKQASAMKPADQSSPVPSIERPWLRLRTGEGAKTPPMRGITLAIVVLLGTTGCRICADCEDIAYPAYGGAWQRTDRNSGRVASLFDPAGAKASALVERDTPEEIDEIERRNRRGSSFTDPIEGDNESDGSATEGDDDPKIESFDNLDERNLDEMEDEKSNQLRDLELEDIEVQSVTPGNAPVAMR